MDKPSWINQVKEVDVDEAKVLLALGVEVWWDYCTETAPWDESAFISGRLGSAGEVYLAEEFNGKMSGWCHKVIYVALGSEE